MQVFRLHICTLTEQSLSFTDSVNQIPKSQARLLRHKTVPIPGDEENYIVGLDMFHQIHCLVCVKLIQLSVTTYVVLLCFSTLFIKSSIPHIIQKYGKIILVTALSFSVKLSCVPLR